MQPQYPTQYPQQPTAPQYPQQPAAPQYPQQPQTYPQPSYPPQQPAYAPPMPQQGYPQAYAQPQYPAQQYGPPPQEPLPAGSLDSFYQQPASTGGPSWKFNQKPIGTWYAGFVARPVTDSDVRAQTDNAGRPQVYKDGRPKFVMVVPMRTEPTQEFPDGLAGWWVKGQARDELGRAMAEAGAPAGAPEAGAFIRVTLVSQRQVPNMNPQLIYRIEYTRPDGVAQVPPPAQVQQPMAPQVMQQPAPMPQPQMAPVMSTATGQPVTYQQNLPPQPQQAPPAPQQQQPQPAAGQAAPDGFSPEQKALFAQLTGQQS